MEGHDEEDDEENGEVNLFADTRCLIVVLVLLNLLSNCSVRRIWDLDGIALAKSQVGRVLSLHCALVFMLHKLYVASLSACKVFARS